MVIALSSVRGIGENGISREFRIKRRLFDLDTWVCFVFSLRLSEADIYRVIKVMFSVMSVFQYVCSCHHSPWCNWSVTIQPPAPPPTPPPPPHHPPPTPLPPPPKSPYRNVQTSLYGAFPSYPRHVQTSSTWTPGSPYQTPPPSHTHTHCWQVGIRPEMSCMCLDWCVSTFYSINCRLSLCMLCIIVIVVVVNLICN